MSHLIEVAFRGNRKEFFRWNAELPPSLKAAIIVEADRGEDLGHVHSTGDLAEVRCRGCPHGCGTAPPERLALREATAEEALRFRDLTAENEDARRRAMERVKANGLVMKLTDAEWQWDRKKLTFYFTADRRVDFRTLVRDLAAMFRTRIELKQIGVRDEAKRLSGIGRCGREYCSASWLPDLRPVNLAVAKDQKLSLNPTQISGACGRLMCCLRYEHEFYVQSRRRFPKEGRILRTSLGEEKVVSCNIFHEQVTLRTAEGDTRVVPLAELRAELEAHGEPLAPERTTEREMAEREVADDVTTDDVILTDTEEYAVARLTMRQSTAQPPAGGTAGAPAASALTSAPVNAVPASSPARVESAPAAGAPAANVSAASAPAAGAPAAGAPAANAARAGDVPTAANADANDVRRKRRRGRRGGRRLRAAEGRGEAPGTQASSDVTRDSGGDASDAREQDDSDDVDEQDRDNGGNPDSGSHDDSPAT